VVTSQHKARKLFQALEASRSAPATGCRIRPVAARTVDLGDVAAHRKDRPRKLKMRTPEAGRCRPQRRGRCRDDELQGAAGHKFAESPVLKLRLPAWRSRLMALLILLLWRADRPRVLPAGAQQRFPAGKRRVALPARPGNFGLARRIADRNGDVLAISTPMKSVWAIPADAKLTRADQAAGQACWRWTPRNWRASWPATRPSSSCVASCRRRWATVAALKLPGIGQDKEYRRFYPTGEMTAHMVGFTGVDDKGLEGVELAFQGSCSGTPAAAA
jgi:cell division protein FtsI (penicillin-binding protein 3)